jgi:hypothetical protein
MVQTVTVRNKGKHALVGALALVLSKLRNATLVSPAGTAESKAVAGSPYVEVGRYQEFRERN